MVIIFGVVQELYRQTKKLGADAPSFVLGY